MDKVYKSKYFFIALVIMIISAVAAYYLLPMNLGNEIIEDFGNSIGDLSEYSALSLAIFIFFNNLRVTLIVWITGLIPFIFIPAIISGINGAVIGAVLKITSEEGSVFKDIATSILPHGVFEIPAICIAVAMGISLCVFVIKKIRGKSDASLPKFLKAQFIYFLKVVLPLLIVAAAIESFVTPLVMNL